MIVGEGTAGKTALANCILGRAHEDPKSTIGINEFTCSIGFANVGEELGQGSGEKSWTELKEQTTEKELERAVARILFDRTKRKKVNRVGTIGNNGINGSLGENTSEVLKVTEEVASEMDAQPLDEYETLHTPHSSEVDSSLVMRYFGEQSTVDSKFVISIFDFGGQSVFNVIHPFFLTSSGVYLLTFNMEWLSSSASSVVRHRCTRYISFWLNSIIIHTQNEKGDIAPIVFVGTRKDLITSLQEHESISSYLYSVFRNSLAWPHVKENDGDNTQPDLCFFPVDNTRGIRDPTVQKLLKVIEDTIDRSSYVHVERPLSWFQVLDDFKSKNCPYLKYSEVESIITSRNIPQQRVPLVLKFFHEMGILMWHDEASLRDIVVFEPIDYFVKPATIIICKHVSNRDRGVCHSTELHKEVRKRFPNEFDEMIQHGIVTDSLLRAMLQKYLPNLDHIKQLMIKYGLMVPVVLTDPEQDEIVELGQPLKQKVEGGELYLVPALLSKKNSHSGMISPIHSFSFVFTTSRILERKSILTKGDCHQYGFLPSGLFEKLITKAIGWSISTSDYVSRQALNNCFKDYAELAFGNQRFVMEVDYFHNLITVEVLDGNNPLSIHDRMIDQIHRITSESFKSLKFYSLLADSNTNSEDLEKRVFIKLEEIRLLVKEKSRLTTPIGEGNYMLSFTEAMQLYPQWLTDFMPYEEYDVFMSYRWSRHDSDFTKALFDRLSLYSVDHTMRRIQTFLDVKRLKEGENFRLSIFSALSKSLLVVAIVSSNALQRLTTLTPTQEDNLLLEWICGLELMKHQQRNIQQGWQVRLMKFMPIFFGTRDEENKIGNIFVEDILSKLPDTIPTACLEQSVYYPELGSS
jgi:GTPase SAR1 family protein